MEDLTLQLVGPEDTAFLQYVPGNFRSLLGRAETVCVGAVYGTAACGAAIAREDRWGAYDLRYVFVDPEVRRCGLGTYLLRGLLGQIRSRGGARVRAIVTHSMLAEGRKTLGILERAGFSKPEPVSTGFSTRLEDIPDVNLAPHPELTVYSAAEAPGAVWREYLELLKTEDLPAFADARGLEGDWEELSCFCTENGGLSGLFLLEREEGACHLAGLYVLPASRGGWTAAALIAHSIRAAKAVLPPQTEVWASAIDRNAFSLCDKLLRGGAHAVKETEFSSVYTF